MTAGCIWGHWDRWHDGMTASMTRAMEVCDGDDLHVVIIGGAAELNTRAEAERADFVERRQTVADRIRDIRDATGYKPKIVYHEYATLAEAIAGGGDYPFDVLFAVEKDQRQCGPFAANVATMQSARAAAGRPPADVDVVPTVYEKETGATLSATRARKRAKRMSLISARRTSERRG